VNGSTQAFAEAEARIGRPIATGVKRPYWSVQRFSDGSETRAFAFPNDRAAMGPMLRGPRIAGLSFATGMIELQKFVRAGPGAVGIRAIGEPPQMGEALVSALLRVLAP
jgi:hypothetical protein